MDNVKVTLFSLPVESAGSKLDRKRSEGSLGIVPKVAILSLMNQMKLSGMSSSQYDFYDIDMLYPSDEKIKEYLLSYKPTVIGISAVVSTSYSQVKRVAKIIRENLPSAWVVMGGNLSAVSEAVLLGTQVDLTVVGDGEVAWIKLLNYFNSVPARTILQDKLLKINGVAFIDGNGEIQLNGFGVSIPGEEMIWPDYDILRSGCQYFPQAVNNYFRPAIKSGWFEFDERALDPNRSPNIAGIFASKGCVAKCTFCQRSTKGYRVQPLEKLEEHLDDLRDNHNIGFIQILDENFGSNKAHTYDVAKILNKKGMLWMATGVRCTSVNKEDIKFYKEHGCSALKFGVESGSQKIMDIMEKKFKVDDVYKALDSCSELGVFSPIAVMVGMPGETEKTARETGEFIGRVAAKIGVHPEIMKYDIFYALPLPGTPLYEYGEQTGVIGRDGSDAADYLERVADAGTYKRYYINLNGAPIQEVLFWEVLIRLEASRVFLKYSNRANRHNSELANKYNQLYVNEKKNNPRLSLKYTSMRFTIITYIIDNYIIGVKYFDYIPRWALYPVVKYMGYFEYIVQTMFAVNRKNNIFTDFKKVPRIKPGETIKRSKTNSLRGIVMRKRKDIGVDEESIHQILVKGM